MQILRDVTQGLRFLHSNRPPILHGDLKGRNILIDSHFRAKLCDFGLSAKKKQISGTPYFLAPEYLKGKQSYSPQCDIYSLGIVIYEIYSRQDPYKGENFKEVLRKVCDRRVSFSKRLHSKDLTWQQLLTASAKTYCFRSTNAHRYPKLVHKRLPISWRNAGHQILFCALDLPN